MDERRRGIEGDGARAHGLGCLHRAVGEHLDALALKVREAGDARDLFTDFTACGIGGEARRVQVDARGVLKLKRRGSNAGYLERGIVKLGHTFTARDPYVVTIR